MYVRIYVFMHICVHVCRCKGVYRYAFSAAAGEWLYEGTDSPLRGLFDGSGATTVRPKKGAIFQSKPWGVFDQPNSLGLKRAWTGPVRSWMSLRFVRNVKVLSVQTTVFYRNCIYAFYLHSVFGRCFMDSVFESLRISVLNVNALFYVCVQCLYSSNAQPF